MKILQITAIFLSAWFATGLPALAQDGRWLRAETANFIVYADRSETQIREAAQQLEDLDATLRIITNSAAPPAETKLEIYLVRSGELRVFWPGVSSMVRGFYNYGPQSMLAVANYDGAGALAGNQILYHEYAHHFMQHYSPHAYPSWYVEGFAEYISTIYFRHRRVTIGSSSGRAGSLMALGITRTRDLISNEGIRGRMDVERFYATSWLATVYLLNDPDRQQRLRRYVEALGEGQDPTEAFEPSFGMTPADFDRELVALGNGSMSRLSFDLNPTPAEASITRLPASMDNLLVRVARARFVEPSEEGAAELAAEIEGYARSFPNDVFAQLALARAALLRDDTVGARASLESVIAADPNNAEAFYLMARSHMRDAERTEDASARNAALSEARRRLAHGFRVNPNYYPTLYLYARSYQMSDAAMTAEQLAVLERAFVLAPQIGEIRFALARELMMAGRYEDAQFVLRPLMYVPHSERRAEMARTMMAAARDRRPPPALADIARSLKKEEEEGD